MEPKFKKGDKCIILDTRYNHSFKIGDEVVGKKKIYLDDSLFEI